MLPRTLEPEVMDDRLEATEYNDMDHRAVNEAFVTDLLSCGELGRDVLDLGTGTALIPVELCKRAPHVRVMAADASTEMLELARYNIEMNNLLDRIQLHRTDAKKLVFQKDYFDCVMSNSIVHHLPSSESYFSESLRVLRSGGLLFARDLCRPETESEVERLVELYVGTETEYSQQLFRQSLHAALTVSELCELIAPMGIHEHCVTMSSDRHWTIAFRKPSIEIQNGNA